MFILFGTRGLKHKIKNGFTLEKSCPNCQDGDLENKLYRRWFTLFFIPIIPLDVIDRFYECNKCKSAYNENIKQVLDESYEKQEQANEEVKKVFAKALIASMTHMAIIDNDFAPEEEKEIKEAIEQFPTMKGMLENIFIDIRNNGNSENKVFEYLNDAREILSSEAVMNILAKAGTVLLADSSIEKEEEQLMKEYLIACGLPKTFYTNLINKLKTENLTKLGNERLN